MKSEIFRSHSFKLFRPLFIDVGGDHTGHRGARAENTY